MTPWVINGPFDPLILSSICPAGQVEVLPAPKAPSLRKRILLGTVSAPSSLSHYL